MATPQKVTTYYKNKGGYDQKVEPERHASRREQNRRLRDEQSTPGERASRAANKAGSVISGAFGTAFNAIGNFNNAVQKRHKNNPVLRGGSGSGMGFGDVMSMRNPFEIPQRQPPAPSRKKRRRPPAQDNPGFDYIGHMHGTPWD